MGGVTSIVNRALGVKSEEGILMVGLDAAGKTTILYKLQLGEVETTIPTIGFNMETLSHEGFRSIVSFTVWDVGGRGGMRPLWRYFYRGKTALVFVVDSNDHERVEDAKYELERMLGEEEFLGKPLLVFANKQDLPGALAPLDLADKFGLNQFRSIEWHIQGCCAHTGDGLYEGLDWLSSRANKKPNHGQTILPTPIVERSMALSKRVEESDFSEAGSTAASETPSHDDVQAY